MTQRFSLFSHILDLESGQLVLTSPFRGTGTQPSLCQFETHQKGITVCEPNHQYSGVAQYHQLLPIQPAHLPFLSNQPVITQLTHHTSQHDDEPFLWQKACTNPLLPHLITFCHAKDEQINHHVCPRLSDNDDAVLELPTTNQISLVEANSPLLQDSSVLNLGPWCHPFRLEGMKLAALDLFHKIPEQPVFLIHDPNGEWSFAFIQMARLLQKLNPGTIPFRLIVAQARPYDFLCQFFEGKDPSQFEAPPTEVPSYQPPPKAVGNTILEGLQALGGTVVSFDIPEDHHFEKGILNQALPILLKTRFIDEDDSLVFLNPFNL